MEVVVARAEVNEKEMKAKAEVAVTQFEMARAKVEEEESKMEGHEVALSHIQGVFLELDLSDFSLLKEIKDGHLVDLTEESEARS